MVEDREKRFRTHNLEGLGVAHGISATVPLVLNSKEMTVVQATQTRFSVAVAVAPGRRA